MVDFSTAIWGTFANPVAAYKAGRAGGGPSQSVGRVFGEGVVGIGGTMGKAALVDFPLALTDGLHAVPKLYGGTVREHGPVTDWKSGGVVASKVRAATDLV
jgi:sterol 3beta-glucosyltransferase